MNENITTETRRESHEAIAPEISKRAALILDVLGRDELTVDEIVNELIRRRVIYTFDRNFVAPRLTELKERGVVEVVGKRVSERTGKNAAVWAAVKKGGNR